MGSAQPVEAPGAQGGGLERQGQRGERSTEAPRAEEEPDPPEHAEHDCCVVNPCRQRPAGGLLPERKQTEQGELGGDEPVRGA